MAASPAVKGTARHCAMGNVLNFLSCALTAVATACAVLGIPSDGRLFDPYWLRNGFCQSNMSSVWLNTHAVSGFVNILGTIALRLLYTKKGKDMNEQVGPVVKGLSVGNFVHGVAHLAFSFALSAKGENGEADADQEAGVVRIPLIDVQDPTGTLVRLGVATLLAKGLLTGVMPFVPKGLIPMFVVLSVGGYEILEVPRRLTFTYVFSWVTMGKIVNQVLLPKDCKGFTYFVMAVVNLPIALIAIVESTLCMDMLIHLGGHAVFDAYITVSVLILYYVVKRREEQHMYVKEIKVN